MDSISENAQLCPARDGRTCVVYRARFDTGTAAIAKVDQPHGTAKEATAAPDAR